MRDVRIVFQSASLLLLLTREKSNKRDQQNKGRGYFVSKFECSSEVARLRQRILLEYEAARRGLTGTAQGTAQHTFITKRLENMSDYHQTLKQLVGEQGAIELLLEVLEQPE
jgi:hypothetical protein